MRYFYLNATAAVLVASIATPALGAVVSPADAKSHVGESVTVEGVASVHTIASGMTFIDLGGRGRNASFTGVIFKDKADQFKNLQSYDGKTVDVTGKVKMYKGAPEIVIEDPSQLTTK